MVNRDIYAEPGEVSCARNLTAQDARFGVRQLADIALRALSPAINDPTTGVLCIKYLEYKEQSYLFIG